MLLERAWALLTKYYSVDQIKNNEIGGACSTYGERCVQDFCSQTWGKQTAWKTDVSSAVISAKEPPVHIGGHSELVLDAWRRETFP